MCSKKSEIKIWSTNKDFIPKLNFKKAVCIGKGDNPKSQNSSLEMCFNWIKRDFFLATKVTTVVYEHSRKARDNPRYTYRITMDEPNSAMVVLRCRPYPQATMVHPRNFKQFETSVMTPRSPQFFRDHHVTFNWTMNVCLGINQMLWYTESDLCLHCLPMFFLWGN